MFDDIKDEATRKICELRIWLSNINDGDDYSAINKGLYYVYIYMGSMKKRFEWLFKRL